MEPIEEVNQENVEESRKREMRTGLLRWGIRETMGVVMAALLLFLPAQTIRWLEGWALVGVYAAWVAACAILIIPRAPDLLIERATRRKGAMKWDMVVLSVIGILTLLRYLLAGFDYRLGWTFMVPAWKWVGLLLAIGGQALLTWSMVTNAYFSMVVRLQEDRGQKVITDGPYRFVRHPGYVGTILFTLGGTMLLGSLWAMLVGVVECIGFILRTAWEDRDLQAELEGYPQYAADVRYRLFPGLW